MNLQIVSNTTRVLSVNKTNEFEMQLASPIDALNSSVYIEVLNVCYPSTTKNVLDNMCWSKMELELQNFKKALEPNFLSKLKADPSLSIADLPRVYKPSELNINTPTVNIPEGIYDLQRIIEILNNAYECYGVVFSIGKNGKVKISVSLNVEYWLQQNNPTYLNVDSTNLDWDYMLSIDGSGLHYHRSSVAFDPPKDQYQWDYFPKKFDYTVRLEFSEKLAFMLGFDKPQHDFILKDTPYTNVMADYLPDVSDGLNKIYVYCDELERTMVGDSSSCMLTTIPLQWHQQGYGDGQLICYKPPKTRKKFKKADIHQLHISLRDHVGALIPFDSGTVTIDCLIHHA